MAFVTPTTPNLADFTTYVYEQGVTTTELPNTSDYITYAFDYAVNVAIYAPMIPSTLYVLAVYQLGFHHLIKIAPDQVGQTYFADLQKKFGLLSFIAGVISASSDESTSSTFAVGEGLKDLPLSAVDLTKTPWGSMYLEYAQQYGPNIVGFT